MKLKLIYPKWKKLKGQTTFNLPPHGPVVFAATLPPYVDISFTDENVEALDFNEECDLVAISMMLSTQVKRGWAIADEYRRRGKQVIFGGRGKSGASHRGGEGARGDGDLRHQRGG